MKLLPTHIFDKTETLSRCFSVLSCLHSRDSRSEINISCGASRKVKTEVGIYAWLWLALYSSNHIYKKKTTKRRFGVKPTFNKRKILNYTCLPYSTSELVNPCPQHFCEESHSAATSLQIVKCATKHKSFIFIDLQLDSVELQKTQRSCRCVS